MFIPYWGGNYKDSEPPLQHTNNALNYIAKLGMTEVKNLLGVHRPNKS